MKALTSNMWKGQEDFSKQLSMGSPRVYFDFQKVFFQYTLGLQ